VPDDAPKLRLVSTKSLRWPAALLANCPINGNANPVLVVFTPDLEQEAAMGRGILLWLLGIPIPIIILILIFWH